MWRVVQAYDKSRKAEKAHRPYGRGQAESALIAWAEWNWVTEGWMPPPLPPARYNVPLPRVDMDGNIRHLGGRGLEGL